MDMRYDSSVMQRLTESTEHLAVDAFNDLEKVRGSLEQISRSDWDDEKRQELEAALDEIKSSLVASARELEEYLKHLRAKMDEFENRGG